MCFGKALVRSETRLARWWNHKERQRSVIDKVVEPKGKAAFGNTHDWLISCLVEHEETGTGGASANHSVSECTTVRHARARISGSECSSRVTRSLDSIMCIKSRDYSSCFASGGRGIRCRMRAPASFGSAKFSPFKIA